MKTTDYLKDLSKKEKFLLMQTIWDELADDADSNPSPEWHLNELRKTEDSFNAGEQESMDWSEAKEQLRKRSK